MRRDSKEYRRRLGYVCEPCGPCAFCGYDDKRHRLLDAILGNWRAGDTAKAIAYNYDMELWRVRKIVRGTR